MGQGDAEHAALVAEVTRRGFLAQAGAVGLGALVASAGPVAQGLVAPPAAHADPNPTDATLQAFADTMIPGRRVARSEQGNEVHPLAIAGVDPLPGAVETDALALYHHPEIGFDALAPAFLGDLQVHSLGAGGQFLDLDFARRVQVATAGLAFENPTRILWEAAAAVPFTAFCAAALVRDATAEKAAGYRVMGLPGTAPNGYANFSYGRRLARERTRAGSLR